MFNIIKIFLKISLINLLFLNHLCCFSVVPQTDGLDSKLVTDLSSTFKLHQHHLSYYDDGLTDESRKRDITEILKRGIKTKEERYMVEGKIDTIVDRVLDGAPFPGHTFPQIYYGDRVSIIVDNCINIRKFPKYGTIDLDDDKTTKRTSNCPGEIYLYENFIGLLGDDKNYGDLPVRSGICYRPKKGEAGNIVYSYKEAMKVIERELTIKSSRYHKGKRITETHHTVGHYDPELILNFGRIFNPFTIEISITDIAGNCITYPKLKSKLNTAYSSSKDWSKNAHLSYSMPLTKNNIADLTQVKDISFTFEPVGDSKANEEYFYLEGISLDYSDRLAGFVPEPISLVTMGLGLTPLLKKRKKN